MPTVSKELAEQIIRNNGFYADDPQVVKIVQYTNAWGGEAYGLVYKDEQRNKYRRSEYIKNPKTIFEIKEDE